MTTGPAAYPETDTAEVAAIHLVKEIIEGNRAKCHINYRDKVPNLDGFIELVNSSLQPVGKVDVQVKKIPDDAMFLPVDTRLVKYSQTTTQPFLLLGVDLKNRRVFWKHIREEMPEFRKDQQSFTLKFSLETDIVDREGVFLISWLRIIHDYQERISGYPRLKELSESPTAGLNGNAVHAFQAYIDRINHLWDHDFGALKRRIFSDVWKFGVGISKADKNDLAFTTFAIPQGSSAPLVRRVSADELKLPQGGDLLSPSAGKIQNIQVTWIQGEGLAGLVRHADNFVFSRVQSALKKRLLPLYGLALYREVLWDFLSNYQHSLGLPEAQEYKISEVHSRFQTFLPAWCTVGFRKFLHHAKTIGAPPIFPSFEMVAGMYPHDLRPSLKEVEAVNHNWSLADTPLLNFRQPGYRHVFDAVEYLKSAGEKTIRNPYRSRSCSGKWVWEGYSAEEVRHNFDAILLPSIEEYASFIKGNVLRGLLDTLPSETETIAYLSDIPEWRSTNGHPYLETCTLSNPDGRLPGRMLVLAGAELSWNKPSLSIEGGEYKKTHYKAEGCDFLFQALPLQHLVHEMVIQAINTTYNQKLRG